MSSESIQWSEEKQKSLQERLAGRWADDTWIIIPSNPKSKRPGYREYLRFPLSSTSLKTEIKYALWSKFDTGELNTQASQASLIANLSFLIEWLNNYTPLLQSLIEKPLEELESSLRDYLTQTGRLRNKRLKTLSASQEYVEYTGADRRLLLLRRCYARISDAYDNRPESERDILDMRKMGLAVNLVRRNPLLNFISITQPWLRRLAKEFMKYNIAVHSPGDCYVKFQSIRAFSVFLSGRDPEGRLAASEIDRSLIVSYVGFLRKKNISDTWRMHLLCNLRIFLETCAHGLAIEGIPRERLIFNEDFPKLPQAQSREIPVEVLEQLRTHLHSLSTSILRIVVILLECGLRINELCSLPLNCLTCDNKQLWSLQFYQMKPKQEHIIPLVDETVIQVIQAQQKFVREQWGSESPYLFPSIKSHLLPFKSDTFAKQLNTWAREHNVRDSKGRLYHFQAHQFRHTVGMRLINDDVPIDVISRLLGHHSLLMTQIYARKRDAQVAEELERTNHKRKTVNYQGKTVHGDARANASDAQLLRKGIRGQTLLVGGCGRLVVLGDCEHANKCLTCPSWLTSTEDILALKAFHSKAIHLKQRALEVGNTIVLQNQDRIIPLLSIRINCLEEASTDGACSADELLSQLRIDLLKTEAGLDEARDAGFIHAAKQLEYRIDELKARIAGL